MVIDTNKCVGCYGCVVSCKSEHFLPPDIFWGRVLISETGELPTVTKQIFPVLCNHCEEAKCVEVCPTGATEKREDGIVWVDSDKCAGCRYCLIACPYQVRVFVSNEQEYFPGQGRTKYEEIGKKLYPHQTGVVSKCNFCMERIDSGREKGLVPGKDEEATPVCVISCPAKARYFGDLEDPESEVSVLIKVKRAIPWHKEHGTSPSVFYILR